jgi:hypothetical protein
LSSQFGELKTRAASFLVAVSAHVALLSGLAYLVRAPQLTEAPVVVVSLVSPFAIRTRPPPSPTRRRTSRSTAPTAIAPPLSPHVPPPIPSVTPPGVATPLPGGDALRRALRASVGCAHADFVNLSAEERAKCKAWPGPIRADGPTYAALPADPVKAGAFARASNNDEAWNAYRDTIRGQYPGLLCAFGRDCAEPGSGAVRLP